MANQNARFKAKPFATVEQIEILSDHLHTHLQEMSVDVKDNSRALAIFEVALLKVLQDVESMSDALVDAGILTDEDYEGGEEVEEPVESDDDDFEQLAEEAEALAKVDTAVVDDESRWEHEGGPAQEDPVARAERIEAARARRAAAIQASGVRAFEEANEDRVPSDPNDIVGLPEEGILLDAYGDPVIEESDTADPAGEYDER